MNPDHACIPTMRPEGMSGPGMGPGSGHNAAHQQALRFGWLFPGLLRCAGFPGAKFGIQAQ